MSLSFWLCPVGGYLSEQLGQTFVIENRAGTGSNLATEAVVRAQPDGYILLATALPNIINTTLYPNLSFNFIRDIAPVDGEAGERCFARSKQSPPMLNAPKTIEHEPLVGADELKKPFASYRRM